MTEIRFVIPEGAIVDCSEPRAEEEPADSPPPDITATSLGITLGTEETIIANSDTGFGMEALTVLQGSSTTGQGLVFYGANGNNISDNNATGAFAERRPFIYAASLPNSQSITSPLQVGSDSAPGLVFFGQFQQLENNADLGAVVTPNSPASRDFAFDDDTATPESHLSANEFEVSDSSEDGSTYAGRVLDLRNNAQIGVVGNSLGHNSCAIERPVTFESIVFLSHGRGMSKLLISQCHRSHIQRIQ